MRIIVPIKQVPESEELRYDPATRTLAREGVTSIINAFDKRALTEAVRLRSLHGGEITAITMGPPQAREALVECLGRGVDRAVHLSDRALAGSDTLATARALAAAIKRIPFDMVLAGKASTDSETGQVGPEVAELLGVPQVTGATSIEVVEGGLLVTRETDWGYERIECPMPAVMTASERLIKPVKTKPALIEEGRRRLDEDPSLIETWGIDELGLSPREVGLTGSPTWVHDLRAVEIDREHTLLSGSDPASLAESLLLALEARNLRNLGAWARDLPPLYPPPEKKAPDREIWAVCECLPNQDGEAERLRGVSLELVGEARRLASLAGGEAVAVLVGRGVEAWIEETAQNGANRVLVADAPELATYSAESYAWVLAREIEERQPWAVLLPATSFGRDLAPRVAARLGLGLTGDCVGLELDPEGELLQLKPAFGGQVIAPIGSRTTPKMSTIRPGMLPRYAPDLGHEAVVESLDTGGVPAPRARVLEVKYEGEEGLALDNARLVVCAGMGIGGPEALPEVERLAAALGRWMGLTHEEVAVGGTRKVVDEGWLPRTRQIGITGHAVAPALYVGIGLNGNFNHTSGILGARTVVAVNTNPQAPIFEAADVGVVAGWRAFCEALIRLLA